MDFPNVPAKSVIPGDSVWFPTYFVSGRESHYTVRTVRSAYEGLNLGNDVITHMFAETGEHYSTGANDPVRVYSLKMLI